MKCPHCNQPMLQKSTGYGAFSWLVCVNPLCGKIDAEKKATND